MTAVLQASHPEEDFGWMGNEVSAMYSALVAAGWPVVECKGPGVLGRLTGVLVQRHLDGSGWIMGWHGATTCVPADMLGDQPPGGDPITTRAWSPVNIHNLTPSQAKVLCAIGAATPAGYTGADVRSEWWGVGLLDEEIAAATGLAVATIAKHRADLVHKCLVRDKQGIYRRREAAPDLRAQVWVATKAGYHALRPPQPSFELLAERIDRQQLAAATPEATNGETR